MKLEIADFVSRCLTCQQVEALLKGLVGYLNSLSVSEWEWEEISMDFISGLPRKAKGFDTIWVIVDHVTKLAYFIPGKVTYSVETWAQMYLRKIIRLYGVQVRIIFD